MSTQSLASVTPTVKDKRPTLLVVDDEEGPRQALEILFRNEYNVLLAENGPAALELARNNQIDAAVLDIRMAGMSGIELLNHLKKMEPGIEVIMLTAYETLETARQALRLGACDYLNKPLDIQTMRQAVANAMERRAFSKEMRDYSQELKQLQEEIHNQKLKEELARTRGEIYASIIHDINGPLTIISGFAEVINQRLAQATRIEGEDLEVIKDRLSRITRQVGSCVQIVKRYLSFLRNRSGEVQTVAVNQILADLASLLRTHPCTQRNKLVIRPLAPEALARINGTDLLQVLLNLTANGFQSSAEPNQVEIEGYTLSEPLDLDRIVDGPQDRFINREGFAKEPPFVVLSVKDTGPGIAPEHIRQLFTPFFTTKPVDEGTGLGLSIVKRLIEQAKGGIHLHSQLGQGTTFTLYLPGVAESK